MKTKWFKKQISCLLAVAMAVTGVSVTPGTTKAETKSKSVKKAAGISMDSYTDAVYDSKHEEVTGYILTPRNASGSVGETVNIPIKFVDKDDKTKILEPSEPITVNWSKRAVGTNGQFVTDDDDKEIYQPLTEKGSTLSYTLLASDFNNHDNCVIKAEITCGTNTYTRLINISKLLPFSTDDATLNMYEIVDSRDNIVYDDYSTVFYDDNGKANLYAPKIAKDGYTFTYSWSYKTDRIDKDEKVVSVPIDGETAYKIEVDKSHDYDTVVTDDAPNNSYDTDSSGVFTCELNVSYNGVNIDKYVLNYWVYSNGSFDIINYSQSEYVEYTSLGKEVVLNVGTLDYDKSIYDVSYQWIHEINDDDVEVIKTDDNYTVEDGKLTIKALKEDMFYKGKKSTSYYCKLFLVPKGEKGNPKYDPALGECDEYYYSDTTDENGNNSSRAYGFCHSSRNFTINLTDEYNFYTYTDEVAYEKAVGESVQFNVYGRSNSGKDMYVKWYDLKDTDLSDYYYDTVEDENDYITDFNLKSDDDGKVLEPVKVVNTAGLFEWSYDIASLTEDDFHKYVAVVCDQKDMRSHTFEINKITLSDDVYRVTPSENSVKAKIGDTIDLKAEARSNKDLTYTWSKLNKQLNSYERLDSTSNVQTINIKDSFDFTTYICYVSNGFDTKTIYYYVHEQGISLVRLSNYSTFATAGDKLDFKVKVVGNTANHDLKYTWRYKGKDYTDFKDTFTIDSLAEDGYGEVTCYVVDETTGEADDISFFVLKYSKVSLKRVSEAETYVKEGSNLKLEAKVDNPDNLELEYKWYFDPDDEDFYNYAAEDDKGLLLADATNSLSLQLDNITENKYGRYTLVAYNKNVQASQVYFDVKKISDEEATIDLVPNVAKEQTVALGKKAVFSVTAKSNLNHELRYQWYKDDVAIAGATQSSYTIDNVTFSDYGLYQVRVCDTNVENESAKYGTDDSVEEWHEFLLNYDTKLSVDVDTIDNYVSLKSVAGSVNKALTLSVNPTSVDSEYPETYQWYYTGDKKYYYTYNFPNSVSNGTLAGLSTYIIPGATSKSYKISSVTPDTVGNYYCVISNTFEKFVVGYNVYASTGLKVTPAKTTYYANIGKAVTIKANVSYNKGYAPTYRWYDPNGNLITDSTKYSGFNTKNLKINSVTEDSYGEYELFVDNGYETAELGFNLSRNKSVGITKISTQTKVTTPGSKIKVTATAKVPSTSKYKVVYKWYYVDPNTGDYLPATTYKKVKSKYKKFAGNAKSVYIAAPKYRRTVANQGSPAVGYTGFKCVMNIYNKSDGTKAAINDNGYLRDGYDEYESNSVIIVNPSYKTKKPQSKHKYLKSTDDLIYTLAGYKTTKKKAKKLVLKFDKKTSFSRADNNHGYYDRFYIINQNGIATEYVGKELAGKQVTVSGKKVAFLLISYPNEKGTATSYGYKIKICHA